MAVLLDLALSRPCVSCFVLPVGLTWQFRPEEARKHEQIVVDAVV
jgi:hypothetical protein